MADKHPDSSRPWPGDAGETDATVSGFKEMGERVFARTLHLGRHGQIALERAVRILRTYFVDWRDRAPRQGKLHWLMLVGDHTNGARPVKPSRERPEFEIWAFVDHEAYKGLNRHWGHARELLASEVGHWAAITFSVFTVAEVERFRASNAFLAERYDYGLILYDRAMDPPRDAAVQTIHNRIAATADALPGQQGLAFRHYRRHGLDIASLARTLGTGEGEAELHLSEAFWALIAVLKADACAHSLRPGARDHPRYNLDLYHRHRDHDRLLAVSRYRFAVSFAETMAEALRRPFIVVHQAAYAAEFALKAVLLWAGCSDDWNRTVIGLDIGAALHAALTCGLPTQPPEIEWLIAPLTRFHRDGRTPALARDVLEVRSAAEIVATIRGLLNAVGQVTGYRGLQGEDA